MKGSPALTSVTHGRDLTMSKRSRRATLPASVDEQRYRAWIAHIFDRPEASKACSFDEAPSPFAATPSEIVGLIGATMLHAGRDLDAFTNADVYQGLNTIFSPLCSSYAGSFRAADVPLELRLFAIRAIRHFYQDCLAPRCDPGLGHLNEGSANPLNRIAYMIWDSRPMSDITQGVLDAEKAFVDVLAIALRSANDACIESALHGLGHQRHAWPSLIDPILEHFLATTRDADEPAAKASRGLRAVRWQLRTYAHRARFSYVL